MTKEMELGIDKLTSKICADYAKFIGNISAGSYEDKKLQIREWSNKVQIRVGKKYIKIITGRSVWGFVVLEDSKRRISGDLFSAGDILKAASYNAPAKNFARGNVLKGGMMVQWNGAC